MITSPCALAWTTWATSYWRTFFSCGWKRAPRAEWSISPAPATSTRGWTSKISTTTCSRSSLTAAASWPTFTSHRSWLAWRRGKEWLRLPFTLVRRYKILPDFLILQQWKRLLECSWCPWVWAVIIVIFTLARTSNYLNWSLCLLSLSGYVQSSWTSHYSTLYRILVQVVMFMFFVSCEAGAQTVVYCAVSDEVLPHSGGYFTDCQLATLRAFARDSGVAKKLWEASERLVKLVWLWFIDKI